MKTLAISVTLHDLAGAPINPKAVTELEKFAEKLALRESLVVNVAKV